MARGWNTSGYPTPNTTTTFPDHLTALDNGVEAALMCDAGTSDPSSGAPTAWGSDEVGRLWFDRTNEPGAGGDNAGGITKRWERTAAGTYSMRTLGLRSYVAKEPNVSLVTATATSATAWSTLDIGGATTSDLSIAARLLVEVQESNPGSGVYFAYRKQGVTTDAQVRRVIPQVSGLSFAAEIQVELDTSQQFDYQFLASGATSANFSIALLGYWERA